MNNAERPEDKKARISFLLILAVCLAVIGYLNHGRVRPELPPNAELRVIYLFFGGVSITCAYVWWANRRDSK